MGFGGSSGGSGSIAGSTDAALSNPANNQALIYDSSVSKWKNATVPAAGSEWATLLDAIPTDGTTDAAPAIQAVYNAGYSFVGKVGGKYLIATPIFIDQPRGTDGLYQHPTWDTQGVLIIDSRVMPYARTYDGTTWTVSTVKRAILIGIKHEAWDQANGWVSIHDEGVNSTKSYYRGSNAGNDDGTPFAFEVRNTTVVGHASTTSTDNNLVVFYSLTGGLNIDNCTLRSFRAFASWKQYTDLHTFSHIHVESGPGQYYPSYFVLQSDYGDGVVITSAKTNGHGIYDGTNNRGLIISGLVTSDLSFTDSEAVIIDGAHEEANIGDAAQWLVFNSGVTVRSSVIYSRDEGSDFSKTLGGVIVIDDSSGSADSGSTLIMENVLQIRRIEYANERHGSLVHIAASSDMTQVIFRNAYASEVTNASPGAHRRTAHNLITSDNVNIQLALAEPAAQHLIASGTFMLSKVSGVWKVTSPDGAQYFTATRMTSPTLTLSAGAASGSLGTSTAYQYAVALENAPGRYTTAVTQNLTTSSTGSAYIRVGSAPGPAVLHIWRATSNVLGAPTQYAKRLINSGRVHGWDLGTTVFGDSWETYDLGTHFAPPTVATSRSVSVFNGLETSLGSETITNLYIDPRATTTSQVVAQSLYTVASASNATLGTTALEATRTSTSAGRINLAVPGGLTPNQQYTFVIRGYSDVDRSIQFYYRPSGYSSSTGQATIMNGFDFTTTPQTFRSVFTTSATANTTPSIAIVHGSGSVSEKFYVTDICIVRGSYPDLDPFNGQTPDTSEVVYEWTGTQDASTSTKSTPA